MMYKSMWYKYRAGRIFLLSLVFSVFLTVAFGDIATMSGVGGVVRDAEKRILSNRPTVIKTGPEHLENIKEPAEIKAMGQSTVDRVVGPISHVRILGSADFARRENISELILTELGDKGDKTIGDILFSLRQVRKKMLSRGYYLFWISLARSGTYDKATQTLSVLVEEGRFGKMNFCFKDKDDGFWFSKDQIAGRFKKILEGETFDYGRLRGVLFDVNSHPDLVVDTSIEVRKVFEGDGDDRRLARYADFLFDVRESMPLHMLLDVNNYGLKDVNEWQTSLTLQYLNLTKKDDVLTISPAMSLGGELVSCAASYMFPHKYWTGGNTTVYGGFSKVEIDDIIPTLDLEGLGHFVGIQHSENLHDTDAHQFALSVGLLWRYIEDQYTVASRSLNSRGVNILPLTMALSYTGKRADLLGGRNFATLQGVYNVMSFGDDLDKMWNGAEENYWIFRAQLARLQPLFGTKNDDGATLHNWQLFSKIECQYTDQNVIPTEKLMLGGYNCLRGYYTRGYVGDYGIYGTLELRTPLLVDSVASLFGDRSNKIAFDRLQFLIFSDWGIAKYNDLPAGFDNNEFLVSAGFGVRLALTKYSQIKCDVAFPLVNGQNDEDDAMEVYCSVQLQF